MATRRRTLSIAAMMILAAACGDPPADPTGVAPSFHRDRGRDRAVVVDPDGRHDATTIQAGIDLAPAGGRVRVLPGTYAERIVIDKALTLEGIGGESEAAIIEQVLSASAPGGGDAVIQVATSAPVVLRGFTIHHVGLRGINAFGATDVTVEGLAFRGEFPFPAPFFNNGVSSVNNATQSGARSRLVVRGNDLQVFGIAVAVGGDVDALLEGNHVEHTASNSGCINVSPTGQGVTVPAGTQTNVTIRDNVFIDCGSLVAGKQNFAIAILGTPNATTGGTVDVVGNTLRNTVRTAPSCNAAAIQYEHFTGRIEGNRVIDAVPDCAAAANRAFPAGISIGSRIAGIRAATVTVRFNDIVGNAFAGLRIHANQPASIDARCNYWGATSGPSGDGLSGTGDAVVVEAGGATPMLTPFARAPIAGRGRHHGDHGDDDDDDRRSRDTCRLEFSLWSEPVNLGSVINTSGAENHATLSPNGLSLYFTSSRAGGLGANDIWVSRRSCEECSWEPPMNLGTPVNSANADAGPHISLDGHLLFIFSNRPGGQGDRDIYVSRRADPADDFGWGPLVNVGPGVNTPDFEAGAEYLDGAEDGTTNFYFGRAPVGTSAFTVYAASVTRDGRTRGPAVLVSELGAGTGVTIRPDGRELLLLSSRAGTLGLEDLWAATRRSVHDAWSTPQNVGAPVNTSFDDRHPSLSADGRTLLFASNRPGGVGGDDLWMSTRTRVGHGDVDDDDD